MYSEYLWDFYYHEIFTTLVNHMNLEYLIRNNDYVVLPQIGSKVIVINHYIALGKTK